MKKKLLTFILSICFILPCMFMLSACSTTPADIEFKVENGYIQYYDGETWSNLIAVEDLKGEDGNDGVGIDGREVEFRKTESSIQWRYVDSTQGADENWKFLVFLSNIKGEDGADGSTWHSGNGVPPDPNLYGNFKAGDYYLDTSTSNVYKCWKWSEGTLKWLLEVNLNANIEKVTVNFDVNLPEYMYEFDSYIASNEKLQETRIDKGSWLGLENFEGTKLEEYFLGWYIGEGIDETKITRYTSINANCTLTAKWDYDKIGETYTSYGVKLRDWLNDTIEASLTSNCGDIVHIAKTHSGKTISLVNDFAYATNTIEVILPYTASTGYEGIVVNDSVLETWNNSTLEKVSWMEYNITMGETPVPAKTIGRYSFLGCSALMEIDIPSHIKSIGNRAFENCTNLEYVDCGGVTTINDKAFYDCTSLESVDLWNVETIGEYAFYNCSSLRYSGEYNWFDFYITESVKEIGNNAFEGCTSLTTISLNSTEIANLTNDNSYLFSYADTIMIRKEITTETTAYLDDSQGNFLRQETSSLDSHDKLTKVEI